MYIHKETPMCKRKNDFVNRKENKIMPKWKRQSSQHYSLHNIKNGQCILKNIKAIGLLKHDRLAKVLKGSDFKDPNS